MKDKRCADLPHLPGGLSAGLLPAVVVDSSSDAIVLSQLDGTIIGWNPAAERLYGWPGAEAIGQSIEMIVPETRREELSTIMSRLESGELTAVFETVRTRRDGSEMNVSATLSPVYDIEGRVAGTCFIARDIADLRPLEQIQAQLASVVESAEDAIVSLDKNGHVLSWNPGAEHLFGYSSAEMLGRFYGEILSGEAQEDFKALFAKAMAGERLSHYETTRQRRDGSTIEVSLSLAPMFAADGSVVGESAILHDITERKERERELSASQALLERAQRVGRIGGWSGGSDLDARSSWTSETFRIFGVAERPDLTTADYYERVHPDDFSRVQSAVHSAMAEGHRYEIEYRIVRPDGTQRWVFEAADVVVGDGGTPVELTGVVQDITERHEAEETMRAVEHQLRLLAENSPDLIFRYRLDNPERFELVSPASLAITGYTPDELYADAGLIDLVIGPGDRELWMQRLLSGEAEEAEDIQFTRKDGSRIWVSQRLNVVRDSSGGVIAVEGIVRDISERKAAEQRFEFEALHDPLTRLPNRVLVTDRIETGLARGARDRSVVAVLFVDIDRFKVVNDTRGHARGDAFLRSVAYRLAQHSRAGDTVGRFSGDEFIVVSEGLRLASDAITIADRILNLFEAPFIADGEIVHLTASIGIAIGAAGEGADDLLRDADLAMYRAKDRGGGRYEMFDDALRAEAERRASTEAGLRRALDNNELALVFQPVWSIAEERFVGAEALLRWHDPESGTIVPTEFIPIAEECGLIVQIGDWVLAQACELLSLWGRGGPRLAACSVSVNVSALQLRSRDFTDALEEAIAASGIDPKLLCLEITESVLMGDVDFFAGSLHRLREIGVRLSIDDFGTGYSSLAYLRRFPVDELKIDRSFVAGLGSDTYDATLVAAAIAIADALSLRVVAEGVETAVQLAVLRDLGCQYAQGYLLARPLAVEDCAALLDGGD